MRVRVWPNSFQTFLFLKKPVFIFSLTYDLRSRCRMLCQNSWFSSSSIRKMKMSSKIISLLSFWQLKLKEQIWLAISRIFNKNFSIDFGWQFYDFFFKNNTSYFFSKNYFLIDLTVNFTIFFLKQQRRIGF